MKLRDERYLFHLTPWVFFSLWLAAAVALGWLLHDAPLWLRVLIGAPVGWTMPFYIVRMLGRADGCTQSERSQLPRSERPPDER